MDFRSTDNQHPKMNRMISFERICPTESTDNFEYYRITHYAERAGI